MDKKKFIRKLIKKSIFSPAYPRAAAVGQAPPPAARAPAPSAREGPPAPRQKGADTNGLDANCKMGLRPEPGGHLRLALCGPQESGQERRPGQLDPAGCPGIPGGHPFPGRTGARPLWARALRPLHGQHPAAEAPDQSAHRRRDSLQGPRLVRQQAQHPGRQMGHALSPAPARSRISDPHPRSSLRTVRRPHPRQPQVPAQTGRDPHAADPGRARRFLPGTVAQPHRRHGCELYHAAEDQHLRHQRLSQGHVGRGRWY